MEHSQVITDALRSDHEEADSRMFAHVSHTIQLYSPGGVVIRNIVKLTLMPLDLTMKKQIRDCLYMFRMQWNYIQREELLYGT